MAKHRPGTVVSYRGPGGEERHGLVLATSPTRLYVARSSTRGEGRPNRQHISLSAFWVSDRQWFTVERAVVTATLGVVKKSHLEELAEKHDQWLEAIGLLRPGAAVWAVTGFTRSPDFKARPAVVLGPTSQGDGVVVAASTTSETARVLDLGSVGGAPLRISELRSISTSAVAGGVRGGSVSPAQLGEVERFFGDTPAAMDSRFEESWR